MSDRLAARIEAARDALIRIAWVHSFEVLSERVVEGIGLLRIRALLVNSDVIYLVERFEEADGRIAVGKYSFHWQRADGSLIRRWDNSPHYPDISSFPHHVHDGDENHVLAHEAVDVFGVLEMMEMMEKGLAGLAA